jgi:hypothetical protein
MEYSKEELVEREMLIDSILKSLEELGINEEL